MMRDHEIHYLVLEETKELSHVEWFSNRCLLNVMDKTSVCFTGKKRYDEFTVFELVFHFLFFRISSTNFDQVYFHPHYMTHLSFVYT